MNHMAASFKKCVGRRDRCAVVPCRVKKKNVCPKHGRNIRDWFRQELVFSLSEWRAATTKVARLIMIYSFLDPRSIFRMSRMYNRLRDSRSHVIRLLLRI